MSMYRLGLLAVVLGWASLAGAQTTVTVTNGTDVINGTTSSVANLLLNDGGDGISYREAITAINQGASGPGAPYTVEFSGDFTINLAADCAAITRPNTVVNGGANTIIFDGQSRARSGPSLFAATNSQIRNISARNCGTAALLLVGANGVVVRGCTFTNSTAGISLTPLVGISGCIIGGTTAGEGNTITGNDVGVLLDSAATNIRISGNSIYGNDDSNGATVDGIRLAAGANGGIAAPVISGLSPVSGSAPANATVEIFADSGSQGETYITSATADGSGVWSTTLDAASSIYEGVNLTATATGTGGNTSAFSAAVAVVSTPPAVAAITLDDTAVTNEPVVHFSVAFTEAVTGIETGGAGDDFALSVTGVTGAAVTDVSGSGTDYTITVAVGSDEGTIALTVLDTGGIDDAAGLPFTGAVTSTVFYTIDRINVDVDLPSNIDVMRGDTVTLEIEASGPNDLDYQWFRNTPTKSLLPIGPNGPALTLTNIALTDEAVSYVEVSDGNETVRSNEAELHVSIGVPASGAWATAALAVSLCLVALYLLRAKAPVRR
ncbi:MAG: right-handed parallel beta-helix repeat-containing protein [Candidatus Hydrogenedentes bacterium]|nr:right-handed parallel beta-helix repeat-containing protein [Candidatus Hydrogenedentota bacterium]